MTRHLWFGGGRSLFGLQEAVGRSGTSFATPIRLGLEDGGALLDHGLIEKEAEAFGGAGGALSGKEL